MLKSKNDVVRILIVIVVSLAILRGSYLLLEILNYEAAPIHHGGDGAIYTTVGRGILSGLQPYTDLFEIKPPGMFLISAFSLWATGGIVLANWLQAAALVIIFLTITAYAVVLWNQKKTPVSRLGIVGSVILGMLFVLYAENQSGGFNTEPFGTACAILYLFCVETFNERRPGIWKIAFMSACILFATELKEPFFFLMLLGGFFLRPNWRSVLWNIVVPFVAAMTIGAAIMAWTGILEPYLTIYMREMTQNRMHMFDMPVWAYIFYPMKVIRNAFSFSPVLTIGLLLVWFASLLFRTNAKEQMGRNILVICLPLTLAAYIYAEQVMMTLGVLNGARDNDLIIPVYTFACVYCIAIWFLCSVVDRERRWQTWEYFLLHAGVFLGTVYLIGSGGFLKQQFTFGITIYTALWFLFLRYAVAKSNEMYAEKWMQVIVGVLVVAILSYQGGDITKKLQDETLQYQNDITVAKNIDALMDACSIDRYALYAVPIPYHLTKHLPTGPAFSRLMFVFPIGKKQIVPFLEKEWVARMLRAQIVFAPLPKQPGETFGTSADLDIPDDVVAEMKKTFTLEQPTCAKGTSALPSYTLILFRRDMVAKGLKANKL